MSESKTIILRGKEQADHAVKIVNSLPQDKDNPKWVVSIDRYSSIRSKKINALHWVRMSHISDNKFIYRDEFDDDGNPYTRRISMSKDGWHYWYAMKFLEPLVIPNPNEPGQEMFLPMPTRSLSNSKMVEFMNMIEEDNLSDGIILPNPQDLMEFI